MRITSGPKNPKDGVVGMFVKKEKIRGDAACDRTGQTIYEVDSSLKCISPVKLRQGSRGEKGKASFDNMSMLALNRTLLLMRVGTTQTMSNALRH